MSEQKQSFMQLLDSWSDQAVIAPLVHPTQFPEEWDDTIERVKKAIREKVLDSYKNGVKAGAGAVRREAREGRR